MVEMEREGVGRLEECSCRESGCIIPGKEQETFKKEGKLSVSKGGLWEVVRKLIGRGVD